MSILRALTSILFVPALVGPLAAQTVAEAPAQPEAAPAEAPAEDTAMLLFNGRIRLGDDRGKLVEALLVRAGRVVAAGDLLELTTGALDAESWQRIDLDGATVVPGLQDAHGHVEAYGGQLTHVDLRGARSFEDLVRRVAAAALETEEGEWILGRGWNQNQWASQQLPLHGALSDAVPDHPVFLSHIDGHAALVNERALVIAGLDGKLDPPPRMQGGKIHLDADGFASGVFLDTAMSRITEHIPAPGVEERTALFLRAQEELLRLGLTAVHDMGVDLEMIEILTDLRSKGLLKLRIVAYFAGDDGWGETTLKKLPEPDDLDLFSVQGVSLMADGALASRGAALLEAYADDDTKGHLLLTREVLARRIALVAQAGLQPAVHATGDRANRVVLDIYDDLSVAFPGFHRLRPRVEHARLVAPKDWPRFPGLGVIPSMQPVHAVNQPVWIEQRLGAERAQSAASWRLLAPALGRLAFGSGFPSSPANPLEGIHAARTRHHAGGTAEDSFLPMRRLDGSEALMGFTLGAAYAAHQEDRRGCLLPGYAADMTVIDVDPLECEAEELLEARVLMTVINGEVLYSAR